jgi:phage terminase small subunit
MNPRIKPVMAPLELAFVDEMVRAPDNPTTCAIRAGYHQIAAPAAARALMARIDITQAINEGRATVRQIVAERTGVELADVIRLLWEAANLDPAAFYDETGAVRPIHDMPIEARRWLEKMDTEEVIEGRGRDREHVANVKRLGYAKKSTYIEMLARHVGAFELDNRQKTDPLTDLIREMTGGRRNTLGIVE